MPSPDFKSGAFDRSATSPMEQDGSAQAPLRATRDTGERRPGQSSVPPGSGYRISSVLPSGRRR